MCSRNHTHREEDATPDGIPVRLVPAFYLFRCSTGTETSGGGGAYYCIEGTADKRIGHEIAS
jgi:hypothetical protein